MATTKIPVVLFTKIARLNNEYEVRMRDLVEFLVKNYNWEITIQDNRYVCLAKNGYSFDITSATVFDLLKVLNEYGEYRPKAQPFDVTTKRNSDSEGTDPE